MSTNRNEGFSWGSLILGILLLVASFIAFTQPGAALGTFAIFFALIIVLYGINNIVRFFRLRNTPADGVMNWVALVTGVISAIIGIYFILNPLVSTTVLTIIFAIWFLSIFISGLFGLGLVRQFSTALFWVGLIINILGIIIGLMMLFSPAGAIITLEMMVAIGLLFGGITLIAGAFF